MYPATRYLALLLVLGLVACTAPAQEVIEAILGPLTYQGTLTGAQEVPPVTTDGSGQVTARLDGSRLVVAGTFEGLSGAATAAHVHGPAERGSNAPPVITLSVTDAVSGVVGGAGDLTAEQVADFRAGLYYVNIHTAANPGGEIRGQLDEIVLEATLSGSQEVPPVTTTGSGSATAVLTGNRLTVAGTFANLYDDATAAHVHGPAERGVSVGIVFDLTVDPAISGVFGGGADLSDDQVADFLAGLYYVNIHNVLYPDGEIRGQLDE